MTKYTKRINTAIKEAKIYFDNECIFCGLKAVDGCHIFARGLTKYRYLADCPYNIIPTCRRHHDGLDNNNYSKTKAWQRIRIIRKFHDSEYSYKLDFWLDELKKRIQRRK